MPRYFIHIVRESSRSDDLEGVVLRSDAAARRYALRDALDLILQLRLRPESVATWQLEVVKEPGLTVARVSLAEAAAVLDRPVACVSTGARAGCS